MLSRQACESGGSGLDYANPGLSVSRIYCKMEDATHLMGGLNMNEVVMLDGARPKEILQTAIDKKITAIMSYLSKGKWHVAKIRLTDLTGERLSAESTALHLQRKQRPINIQVHQPVGISFKYEYGKFVFDATVLSLEPSTGADGGGTVVLKAPQRIEVIQRRSYFRVKVPDSLKVNITIWHRKSGDNTQGNQCDEADRTGRYAGGRLIDVSAGGAQLRLNGDSATPRKMFKKGQFIGMRFTALPYETPLVLTAQIRNVLPTADGSSVYLGLQMVGLEASFEGRQVLTRLVAVVERYYRMNQSETKRSVTSQVPAAV